MAGTDNRIKILKGITSVDAYFICRKAAKKLKTPLRLILLCLILGLAGKIDAQSLEYPLINRRKDNC